MKLSTAQKNVIKLMREGYVAQWNKQGLGVWLKLGINGPTASTSQRTLRNLFEMDIITFHPESHPFSDRTVRYILTGLGESVNID